MTALKLGLLLSSCHGMSHGTPPAECEVADDVPAEGLYLSPHWAVQFVVQLKMWMGANDPADL